MGGVSAGWAWDHIPFNENFIMNCWCCGCDFFLLFLSPGRLKGGDLSFLQKLD